MFQILIEKTRWLRGEFHLLLRSWLSAWFAETVFNSGRI